METKIRLSLQLALLGSITENLLAVSVSKISSAGLTINFFQISQQSEVELELMHLVASEVWGDFDTEFEVATNVVKRWPNNDDKESNMIFVFSRSREL